MKLSCLSWWLSQFCWDSQLGKARTTSILVLTFWNFQFKVLIYPENCRLHDTCTHPLMRFSYTAVFYLIRFFKTKNHVKIPSNMVFILSKKIYFEKKKSVNFLLFLSFFFSSNVQYIGIADFWICLDFNITS